MLALEASVCLLEHADRVWSCVLTEADRRKLGGNLDAAYRAHDGTLDGYMHARGVSRERALLDVALGLGALGASQYAWLLREIGEDPQASLRASIEAGHLVLVEPPREAFWQGTRIDTDWQDCPRCWDLLWALANRARQGQSLHWQELGGCRSASGFSTLKGRLVNKKLFPSSLRSLVTPSGKGGYRLNLPAETIRLIRREDTGTLPDVTA